MAGWLMIPGPEANHSIQPNLIRNGERGECGAQRTNENNGKCESDEKYKI